MKNSMTKTPAPRKPMLLILAAVLVAALLAAWLLRAPMAPQVSGQTITGQAVSSEALKGKPYLVNFWATSCVTCVKEMPDIVAVHQAFVDKGYQTIAVAMNYDRPDYITSFVQDRNIPFMVVHDKDNAWAQAYGDVTVTPTTFVVDGRGRIIKRYVGEPNFADLRKILARELGVN
jgi:peroxiredoxin